MAESGTSVSRENSNQSIDPNEVEILIDSSRMSRNWEDVLHWLKRYAHIFDIGAATSTFQHGNLDSVRAYYWVAMAETVFETKYDSNSAIECAKRAVDIYARCIEANVIVCRVLLHSFRAIIKNGPANLEDDPPSNVDKEPVSSYNDAMHELSKGDQKLISNLIVALDRRCPGLLMSSLEFLSSSDVLSAFQEFLVLTKVHGDSSTRDVRDHSNSITLILLVAQKLLAAVNIADVMIKFNAGRISEYRLWLFLDAVSTRIGIYESLQQMGRAREEGRMFMQAILFTDNENEHEDGDEEVEKDRYMGSSVIPRLPESSRAVVLATACRIPLIEMNEGLVDAALESFHVCISGNSQLKSHFPIPIQLGLYVMSALLMLHRARSMCRTKNAHSSVSDRVVYAVVGDDVRTDIDNAFSLLASAHDMMTLRIDSDSASNSAKLHASALDPSPMSQMRLLPGAQGATASTDPRSLADFASSSIIGPFMAIMCKLRESNDKARRRSISILEWGISLEIKPRPDLLWLLAAAYSDGGKPDYAIELLEQCHFAALSNAAASGRLGDVATSAQSSIRNDFSMSSRLPGTILADDELAKLLCWLGAGLSPSAPSNMWLALTRAAELAMDALSDFEAARKFARRGLLEVYEKEGLAILNALGSDDVDNDAVHHESSAAVDTSIGSATRPLDKYRNADGSLSISMSLRHSISRGLCALVFVLGKCHAGISRKASTRDSARVGHLRVAVRAFDLLMRGIHEKVMEDAAAFLKSIEEELILQHAVAMGELGEGSAAIARVRAALGSRFSSSSKLMHLLGLLLASTGDDDPLVLGTAAALCKRASMIAAAEPCSVTAVSSSASAAAVGMGVEDINLEIASEISPSVTAKKTAPSPNARLTMSLLEIAAGGVRDGALKAVDQTVTVALTEFRDILQWEVSVREAAIEAGAAATTATASSSFSLSPTRKARRDSIPDDESGVALRSRLAFPEDSAIRLDNPHYVSLMVDVLLTCSRCYRKGGKAVKAKLCLEEAWKLLFKPSKETLQSVEQLLCPEEVEISEHRRIDIMRRIPTLTGWRLSEASGWGTRGFPHLESAVLHEAALQTDNVNTAFELLQMSLTLCPDNTATMIALADFELKRIESIAKAQTTNPAALAPAQNTDPTAFFGRIPSSSSSSASAAVDLASLCQETRAYSYAMGAVRAQDLNPEAWYVLGRVYQALGQVTEAEEAFTTALECMKFDPLRRLSVVLQDHLLRPGR